MIKIFSSSEHFPVSIPAPIVALGNFDGVHLAHQQLLSQTHSLATACKGTTVVYTFYPHPVHILSPQACPQLLQTLEQRVWSFEKAGVAICVVEPFTRDFAKLPPEAFFRTVIVDRLHAQGVVVGYDFTFGIHRQGTVKLLGELCQKNGIALTVVDAQFVGETLISSRGIRAAVGKGDVTHAMELLGHPFELIGRVVPGRGLGKSLGAHTANIDVENDVTPRDGIYLTTTYLVEGMWPDHSRLGEPIRSITSIGNSPTFPGSPHMIETHLLDVEQNLVGQRLAIDFLEWMRDQIAFKSAEELKIQIAEDLNEARRRHDKYQR